MKSVGPYRGVLKSACVGKGVREPAVVDHVTKGAQAMFVNRALGNEGLENSLKRYYFKNQEIDKLKFKENKNIQLLPLGIELK